MISASGTSQPPFAALARALLSEPLVIGRIHENQRERLHRADLTQLGGIAPEDLGNAIQTKRFHVGADEATAFHAIFNKQGRFGATREGFTSNCAGAGKQVQHTRAFHCVVISMHQEC